MKASYGSRKQQILDLVEQHPDWTTADLAAHTGVQEGTVRALCHRAGVKPAPHARTLKAMGGRS